MPSGPPIARPPQYRNPSCHAQRLAAAATRSATSHAAGATPPSAVDVAIPDEVPYNEDMDYYLPDYKLHMTVQP